MNDFSSRLDRRMFIKFIGFTALNFSVSLSGCGLPLGVKGDLTKVAYGSSPYNGINPNLRGRHVQFQTWLDNILQAGKMHHAGTQYNLSSYEKIVTSANGIINKIGTFKWRHYDREAWVEIDHGGGIITRYFHMVPYSAEKFHTETQIKIKRGEVIGFGGPKFKMVMRRYSILGDMDHYGPKFGYMEYWDGKSNLDFEPEEVKLKNETQVSLILDLIKKYTGPGSEQLQDVNPYNKIPLSLCHIRGEICWPWEHAMVFKLVKHIYDNQPEIFNGTKKENDSLIDEIYNNQPVILTLPFNFR